MLDRGLGEGGSPQKCWSSPFTTGICYFCRSGDAVPNARHQGPFGPFFAVLPHRHVQMAEREFPWPLSFLSPVHKCHKRALRLDARSPGRRVEVKSPTLNSAATDRRTGKSTVPLCISAGAEEIPYLLRSSLLRMSRIIPKSKSSSRLAFLWRQNESVVKSVTCSLLGIELEKNVKGSEVKFF